MQTRVYVEIGKPSETVWPVLIDVERWPDWTASVSRVERLDPQPFSLGSRVRIHQPRLKTMVWRVSEFQPGRLLTWEARTPGVLVVARHAIRPSVYGCIVTLTIDQKGWLTPLVSLLFGNLTRQYMQTEAQGLKKRCELR
jgi:uncharacterized membrane protein